jgi:hypothetical protein
MTLPDERYRAVTRTEQFLQRLAGGQIARVPKAVREEAYSLLRHYPSEYYLSMLADSRPDVLDSRGFTVDPLYQMVKNWEDRGDRD